MPVEVQPRVGVVGVSGYSGVELARILARHPRFQLLLAATDRWAGKRLGDCMAMPGAAANVSCVAQSEAATQFRGLDLIFLCTPAEVSIELAPAALAAGARVVDLSGGFRLPAEDYPGWYGFSHPSPALLGEAVYAMPEAGTTSELRLRTARLVANPGCYPTASTLAVLPLLRAGLLEPDTLVVDAKSGTTGAGRKATEEMSFSEVAEDVRPYRVLRHQHAPEIERALVLAGVAGARVVFTPYLLPVRRGILATVYGRLTAAAGPDPTELIQQALDGFADSRPFVHVTAPEEVTLHAAVGSNRAVLGARADARRGIAVALCSIDNLVKGAAGQAVQNANLMFGVPETEGLA